MKDELGTVEMIFRNLTEIIDNDELGFSGFKGKYSYPWGRRSSYDYQERWLDFFADTERLAKKSCIKYENGYYCFNGKIYEKVPEDSIRMAWIKFLRYYHVAEIIRDKQMYNEGFLKTIEYYNIIRTRLDLVAFENGVLDLETMKLHKFSPKFHVTYYHPYEYDPYAKCPRWMSFLHEVLPDKTARVILQMFLGLGLVERGTAFSANEGSEKAKIELCLILIGRGGNGKSVVYEAARGIFGEKRISGVDYDDIVALGDEGMRARRLLRDAIFNWTSDSDYKTFGRKRSGVFKRIVSGEPVTDRAIGHDVTENYRMPYLVFNLNSMPGADDDSVGFVRRLQFIPFEVAIPKERQNKSLSADLIKEYPGIFNWIVRGMKELSRRKFVFPSCDSSKRQILMMQLQANPVVGFVNTYSMRPDKNFEGEVSAGISSAYLLERLEKFCKDNDVEAPSGQYFGAAMRKLGFEKKRRAEGPVYIVYGCDKDALSRTLIVSEKGPGGAYAEEKGTFILKTD